MDKQPNFPGWKKVIENWGNTDNYFSEDPVTIPRLPKAYANRKGDCVIVACQDNKNRRVYISKINESAERLLGVSSKDVQGVDLKLIFSERVRKILAESLEYTNHGKDLGTLFKKIGKCHIVNQKGQLVPVSLKIYYSVPTINTHTFELILKDITLEESALELIELLKTNKSNKSLVSKKDFLNNLKVILPFISNRNLKATFGTIEISNLHNITFYKGSKIVKNILLEVQNRFRAVCREEDFIGCFDNNSLGFTLIDCDKETASKVIYRIASEIKSRPVIVSTIERFNIQPVIKFIEIKDNIDLNELTLSLSQF
jgi:uncharacterized protein YlxP (DUF503 family)